MANSIVQNTSKELPGFTEPDSVETAESNIAYLGCNMAEHAYLLGRNLIWVKEQLKHGIFEREEIEYG